MRAKENEFSLLSVSRYRAEIMGIAIMWIMLFHADIPSPNNFKLEILWYCFVCFGGGIGVDIFLLVSGFGLVFSNMKNSCCHSWASYGRFIKKRLCRIAFPYLVVGSVRYVVRGCMTGGLTLVGFLQDLLLINYFRGVSGTYWFIPCIIVCYLIFPLYAFLTGKKDKYLITAVFLVALFILDCVILEYAPNYYEHIEILLLRIPSFIMGSLLGIMALTPDTKVLKGNRLLFFSIVLFVVSLIAFFHVLLFHEMTTRLNRYIFMAMSVAILLLLSYLLMYLESINLLLRKVGVMSLQLYLIHVPIFSLISKLIGSELVGLRFLVGTVISMILSFDLFYVENAIPKLHKAGLKEEG